MTTEVGFAYGCISKPLEEQANVQGFTLGEDAELLEKIKVSLCVCRIHSIISDGEATKAYGRLNKKTIAALKRLPEPPDMEVDND